MKSRERMTATMIAELQRLAVDGIAPSSAEYNTRRAPGTPSAGWATYAVGLKYSDLVARAGLLPCQAARRPASAQMEIFMAELQRLAEDGIAPSSRKFDRARGEGVPTVQWAIQYAGCTYNDLVTQAGLVVRRYHHNTMAAEQTPDWPAGSVAAALAGATPVSHNDRYHAALAVAPEPTRVERVTGRTLDGQHVVIVREYRMVR